MLCLLLLTFLNISSCLANIQFNCDTGPSQHVVYQCVAEGSTLGWKIYNGTSTTEKEYSEGIAVNNPEPVPDAPDFTTTLLSNTPPLKSSISFTMQPDLTGYIIQCYDVSDTKECKLIVPSQLNITYNTTGLCDDIAQIQIIWMSDQSDRPSLIAVYVSHNVSGEETEQKLPGSESDTFTTNVSRGVQYQFAVFGENIVGNGTESRVLVSPSSRSVSTATGSLPTTSVSDSVSIETEALSTNSVHSSTSVNEPSVTSPPIEDNGNNGSISVSTSPTESTTEATSTSSNTLPIIGGVVGGTVAIVAIIIIILAAIAGYVYYKNRKNKTSGSSSDPIPLRETKRPLT